MKRSIFNRIGRTLLLLSFRDLKSLLTARLSDFIDGGIEEKDAKRMFQICHSSPEL
jgi:hypothetical protein